jgi:hypothetical protein
MTVLASLLIICIAARNYLGGGAGPQPADPDPGAEIVVTEPDDTEPSVPPADPEPDSGEQQSDPEPLIDENGTYDSKEEVALYIITYGKLPPN